MLSYLENHAAPIFASHAVHSLDAQTIRPHTLTCASSASSPLAVAAPPSLLHSLLLTMADDAPAAAFQRLPTNVVPEKVGRALLA